MPDSKTRVRLRPEPHADLARLRHLGRGRRRSREKLFRETTKAWVDDPGEPQFLTDGSFLFPSERSGWKHLYHYAADGKLIAPGHDGRVGGRATCYRVDEESGCVYFTGTKDGHTGSNLYRVKLDGGERRAAHRPKGETHRVDARPDRRRCSSTASATTTTPTQVGALRDRRQGRCATLDTNPVYEREEYKFGKYERVQIPMKDGFVLEGAIIYPPDFDPTKKYPVWFRPTPGRTPRRSATSWGGGRVLEQVAGDERASSSSASTRAAPAARGRCRRGRATSSSACRS